MLTVFEFYLIFHFLNSECYDTLVYTELQQHLCLVIEGDSPNLAFTKSREKLFFFPELKALN